MEIKPVNPKGKQPWVFNGRTEAEAEAPIVWPPDGKNWLIGKYPDAGKYRRQEEKGTTEDKMVGWYHQINGHEFEQALGDCEGQESLVCCSPWHHRVGHDWATEEQQDQTINKQCMIISINNHNFPFTIKPYITFKQTVVVLSGFFCMLTLLLSLVLTHR